MKNQRKVLHLRVYSSYGNRPDVAYDQNKEVLNPNQIVKMQHDTLEYSNMLKNMQFMGWVKVEVEKITVQNSNKTWSESKGSKEKYQHEVNIAFLGKEKAEALLKTESEDDKDGDDDSTGPGNEVSELEKLQAEYIKVVGKKPHHKWNLETLTNKLSLATE